MVEGMSLALVRLGFPGRRLRSGSTKSAEEMWLAAARATSGSLAPFKAPSVARSEFLWSSPSGVTMALNVDGTLWQEVP